MLVYLNGRFVPDSEALVSALDRGFVFGDGVYEVWRVIDGRLFEGDRHQSRFERGLRELELGQPHDTRPERVLEIAERLFAGNALEDGEATLYMQVTRGAAPRSHPYPPAGTPPTVFATAKRFIPPESQRTSGVSAITQPDVRWSRCDIKTIQLLPNVMANQRAKEAGAFEALFVRDGRLTEGTHASAFGVLGGVLRTHPADRFVLPGITRELVLEIANDKGVPVREEAIDVHEIGRLEELFVSGTTTDVTPVVRLDGKAVGRGTPGPVSKLLHQELKARMAAFASPAAL